MIRKQVIRENIPQISFVCLAFVLMAFVSYFTLSRVVEQNLSNIAEESLRAAEAQIRNGFAEMESAIVNTAFNVEFMLKRGESLETLSAYLAGTTDWMSRRETGRARFLGVYGYIRGNFLDGLGLNPAGDFIPQKTSWYQLAIRSAGKTVFTAPYLDGRTGKMIISTARQVYDNDGQPIGIIALDVDISFLNESIDFLSLAEGGYGIITNQYLSLISYPEKNEIGRQLNELAPDYNRVSDALLRGENVIAERIRDARGDPAIVFFRRLFNGWHVAVVTPNKSYYRDVRYTAVVLSILGSTLAFILCCLLIQLSAARIRSDEENKSKSSFLARMSHEIRTPMNAIIGMSELAARDYGSPEGLGYITEIKNAGTNLLSIINDILDFSKIEAGSLQILSAPYEMASVLNDILNIIQIRLTEKPVKLLADLDADLPAVMVGDEVRVRQILLNLLSNAAKYTKEGYIRFSASSELMGEDVVKLTFTVEDSGVGIRQDDLPKLFGEFVRVGGDSDRASIEGTGLGLAISRNLCRRMGGDVTVSSEYGKGSVFTAVITQKRINSKTLGIIKKSDGRSPGANGVKFTAPDIRVLVVDDIETNLTVAAGLLSPYRFQIDTCLGGNEAISKTKETRYDFIFMDHMMPGVNGIEATAAIRATEGDYFKQVPIIALTANAVSGMREMFLANGFSDFLAKPIELQKLNALIERWVPQEKRVRAEGGAAHESAPIEVDLKIDGVDVPRGIMMTGGTLEGYKNVLGLYCRDVSERLEILREPRDEIELAQIVIQVHALKSASASIGAVSVAESAAFLEDAGRQGDMGAVLARFGDFRDSLGILYENIRSVLSPDSQSGERAIDIEALERLQAALLAENIREADSVVMELENAGVDDKTREFLSITAEKILLSEFKSAAVSVEDFIRENRK